MNTAKLEALAHELLGKHGLSERGWTFQWDRAKRRLGCCSHRRRLITVSKPLAELNGEEEMVDTILHEIAHALTPGAGHGPEWKRMARRLGAKPERVARDSVPAPALWHGVCQVCGHISERYRMSDRARRSACGKCCKRHNGGRWSAEYLLVWKRV